MARPPASSNNPRKPPGTGQRQSKGQKNSKVSSPITPKLFLKQSQRLAERYGRRATTDPFTTHIAGQVIIGAMHGRKAHPKVDLAPRIFPGARTIFGQAEERL